MISGNDVRRINMTAGKLVRGIIFLGAIWFLLILAKHITGEREISAAAKTKLERIEKIKNSRRELEENTITGNIQENIKNDIISKIDETDIQSKFDEARIASVCIGDAGNSPFLFVYWIGDEAWADHVVVHCEGKLFSFKIPETALTENRKREKQFISYKATIQFDEENPIPDCLKTNEQVKISLARGAKILPASGMVIKNASSTVSQSILPSPGTDSGDLTRE